MLRTQRKQDLVGGRSTRSFLPRRAGGRSYGVRPPPRSASRRGRFSERRAGSRARRSPTRSWSCRCRDGCWRSGHTLQTPIRTCCAEPADAELNELLARFEPLAPAPDDCGARDWSDLHQRMHYIVHLFRAFQLSEQLSRPPFTPDQVASFSRGVIPEGEL